MNANSAEEEVPAASGRRAWVWKLVAVGVVALALIAVGFLLPVRGYAEAFLKWVQGLGFWAPIFVVLFYVVACVLLLPGGIITIGAGFILGLVRGTIAVSIGSTLGACAAFLVGRYVARGWVERKTAGHPKFAAIDEAVARQGFKIVLLTRLSPIFPFNLQNYAYGLTKVSFWRYALASWIGMLPGTIVYVYIGSAAKSLTEAVAGTTGHDRLKQVLFWAGLAATIAVVAYVSRVAQKAVKRAVPSKQAQTKEVDK
jgi:uncharacterized membrane protein YdjX (TVP38/TMEM64 family)